MAGRHVKGPQLQPHSVDQTADRAARLPESGSPARRKPSFVWRFVGFIGELLITAGILIGLFVLWQLWWTDIEANRAQEVAIAEITEEWVEPGPDIGTPRTDPPPEFPHVTDEGAYLGIMRIPRFGEDHAYTIAQGTALETVLDTGAFGHYEDSAYPGEIGNFATAAHRQTYGAPMRGVADLQIGDPIIVETADAYLVYKVTESYIVSPSDSDVVLPVPRHPEMEATQRLLTITTCHPPFVSNQRWIIHAEMDHWIDRGEGIPAELAH